MKKLELRDLVVVAMFAALTAVGAMISIPIGTVPIVLANIVALLSGAILGKWKGALSQVVYVVMGTIGLPVFAGATSGIGVVAGKTGGYLFGYIAGAFITGLLVEYLPVARKRHEESLRFAIALIFGAGVIYLFGVPWLSYSTGLDIKATLAVGLYPFLPGDAVKVAAGTLLCLSLMEVPNFWISPGRKKEPGPAEVE